MIWSIRRITRIRDLIAACSYLEIGVETGATFRNVPIEYKDGVDPAFQFDTTQLATDKVRLFPMTSDAFWTGGQARTYDVMMIDGLHTFEQTFRDILSSLRYSHSRTVWLIDDTIPSDVFSAIPDQRRCYYERRKHKLQSNDWHGDVFKLVPAIREFLPTVNYATIIGSGNPQTLMWYEPRRSFVPQINNLEKVSRMTYFDIEPNLAMFNAMSEDDAFAQLAASISR